MSELDPQLAALLRGTPSPPAALDEAHRQAVLAAARQAWFRQRARSRRNLIGLAAAAVFAAAIAGWTIRSLVDDPVRSAQPAVAVAEHAAERTALRKELQPAATPQALRPAAMSAAAPAAPATPPAPLAAPGGMVAGTAANDAGRDAGPDRRALRAATAAPAAAKAMALEEPAADAMEAGAAPPVRGRLVMAGLVLDAVQTGRLADADRQPSLQAALDSLAGIAGAEAEALRLRLRAALAQH